MNVFDIVNYMSDERCSFGGIIRAMFEHCDENGLILVRDYRADSTGMIPSGKSWYRIDWSHAKCENPMERIAEFHDFLETLRQASLIWNAGIADEENACPSETVDAETLYAALRCFAKIYLKPIDVPFTAEEKDRILHNLEILDEGTLLYERLGQGDELSDSETDTLREYINALLNRKFQCVTDDFMAHVNREAEKRVGTGPMAYDFLTHCSRYCKLLSLDAPAAVINAEEQRLAFAYIIHYCSEPLRAGETRGDC